MMDTAETRRDGGRPVIVPVFALVIGVVLLLVGWLGAESPTFGVFALVLMAAYAGVLRYGHRAESVAILAEHEMDERRRRIDLEATQVAYFVVVLIAVGGFLWEVANGRPGPFTLVATAAGGTHIVATLVLGRLR